jgi:hypothetical protein
VHRNPLKSMHFLAVSAVVFLAVFALIALYWPVLS